MSEGPEDWLKPSWDGLRETLGQLVDGTAGASSLSLPAPAGQRSLLAWQLLCLVERSKLIGPKLEGLIQLEHELGRLSDEDRDRLLEALNS